MVKTVEQEKITKLALIAGHGELPHHLAASAKKSGVEVFVIALNKKTYAGFKGSYQTEYFSPIEVLQIIDSIKSQEIKHMVFIGKVPKLDFFKNIHKLDSRLMHIVKELGDLNDDSLHFALLRFLEEEHGLKVIAQTKYLQDFFPEEQVFSTRQPTKAELAEIQYGLRMAKAIAAVDIGQTVVVKNKAVIAVEAIEGTNNCIKRAANSFAWFKDNRVTVCKVSKPEQDDRFDVPTIGPKTIEAMPVNSILAFEAEQCFFIDQAKAISKANQKNILLCSVTLGIK